ncbi:MAG: hypothetical protein NTW49_06120 [Bacteroidia bacterium]|nr:hypothetical protein [Bacteroidia bacterium]
MRTDFHETKMNAFIQESVTQLWKIVTLFTYFVNHGNVPQGKHLRLSY